VDFTRPLIAATALASWLLPQLVGYRQILGESTALGAESSLAQHPQTVEEELDAYRQLTFDDIPPATEAGGIDLEAALEQQDEVSVGKVIEELGYNPDRDWEAGTPLAEFLFLGDLADATKLEEWTLEAIASVVGEDLSTLALADFPLVGRQNLKSLVEAVPGLRDYDLEAVAPLAALVEQAYGSSVYGSYKNQPLERLLENSTLADLSLDQLDLSAFSLDSVPAIAQTPLGDLPDWKQATIAEIPGLSKLPLERFLKDLHGPGTIFARLDIALGEAEQQRLNTVTGSYQDGFAVPCDQSNCMHVELTDAGFILDEGIRGKQWISGKVQQVRGGSGCLAWMNGGREPTGRHPFGPTFKVVLWDTHEADGTAQFVLFTRIQIFCGESPYFIGPLPWFSGREKELVFIGLPDWLLPSNSGASPSTSPSATDYPNPDRSRADNGNTRENNASSQSDPQADPTNETELATTTLHYPLQQRYRVTSEYGWRTHPLTGVKRFHNGIDLGAPAGTPILASADGVVQSARANVGSCGTYIKIAHGNGLSTGACHLSRLHVAENDRVRRGQVIGEVGSTGAGTGAHLHFIIYQQGSTIDPRSKIDF
jgi:hypothetical protein